MKLGLKIGAVTVVLVLGIYGPLLMASFRPGGSTSDDVPFLTRTSGERHDYWVLNRGNLAMVAAALILYAYVIVHIARRERGRLPVGVSMAVVLLSVTGVLLGVSWPDVHFAVGAPGRVGSALEWRWIYVVRALPGGLAGRLILASLVQTMVSVGALKALARAAGPRRE